MSIFTTYASKNSAYCAAEFAELKEKMPLLTIVMIANINPFIMAIMDLVWPIHSYLHWMLDKLEASYHCAALGDEAGFSLTDGLWDKQLNYIKSTLYEAEAYSKIPYYGWYITWTNGMALKAAFEAL